MNNESFESVEFDDKYEYNDDEIGEHGELLGVDIKNEEYLLEIVM